MSKCANPLHQCGETCTCPHGPTNGRDYYGPDPSTRLRTMPGCPKHDSSTHAWVDPYPDGVPAWHVPPRLCRLCGVPERKHP